MAVDIEQLYITYGPMVLRRCRSLLRDEEAALDAMQDVFVKLIRRKSVIRDEGLSSFLYVTATNTCLNILRSSDRRPIGIDDEWLETVPVSTGHEDRLVNRMFLDGLFKHQLPSTKTIAMLHYRDGLTLEETARIAGMSVSGVRKRLRKLRSDSLVFKEAGR